MHPGRFSGRNEALRGGYVVMVYRKIIHSINELQEIQRLAVESPLPVTLISRDGSMRVDAKSYIGMYALDFSQPVAVESDDEAYMEKVRQIGETIE